MSVKRRPTNSYKETGGEIPAIRWYNRRRLAWWAFYSLIFGTLIYWFGLPLWFTVFGMNISWLTVIGESYSWFASTMAIIVAGYMGIEYIARAKAPTSPRYQDNSDATAEYDDHAETETEVVDEIYDPERK